MNMVGIRFNRWGKIYGFRAEGLGLRRGEMVVVESELGMSIGRVVKDSVVVDDDGGAHKDVLRRATTDDFLQDEENLSLRTEARSYFNERVVARGLTMKLIATDVTLDKKRIIFYFVAESRVDFRELVKDLAAKFKTRIELRQIGVRDAAQMVGGLGICGRPLCCRRFLTSFEPISIKMAKQQELVLNTSKLSGVCGRLMCCLSFECGKEPCHDDRREKTRPEAAETTPEAAESAAQSLSAAPPATQTENPVAGSPKPEPEDKPAALGPATPGSAAPGSAAPGPAATEPASGTQGRPPQKHKRFFRKRGGHGPHKRG